MANAFYVSIVGRQQGPFKSEGGRTDKIEGLGTGKIEGLAFHYEVAAPHDAATGQATGRRQQSPVTFVKEWGAASPQLVTAALRNEILDSVLFEFVNTNPNGEEHIFQTVKLTNASVASIKQDVKASGPELQDLEEVSIVFHSIEMTNIDGKTMAVDNWGQKGSRLSSSSVQSGTSDQPAEISVQEPFAGLTVAAAQAATDKITAPRVLLSRVPSTGA